MVVVNPFAVAINVGVVGVAFCAVSAAAEHDGHWLAVGGGLLGGMAVLRVLRGWWDSTAEQLDCLLAGPVTGDGVGLPVPEPAPMDPANLIELEAAFEALDQRLRLGGSGARVALAAGRRADKCALSTEERLAWVDLVGEFTAGDR